MVRAFSIILMALILGFSSAAVAQDFPYSVPQAPEFDDRGNTTAAPSYATQDGSELKRQLRRQEEDKTDYRTVRPYMPQDGEEQPVGRRQRQEIAAPNQRLVAPKTENYRPPQDNPSVQVNPEAYNQTPVRTPAVARQAPAKAEERLDCTMFPMIIAQSRSDPEMQNAARHYLTCLLKSGWNMEQARAQVISTIESTYKLTR